MNNRERFISTYEEKIKPLRETYYKNKVTAGLGDNIFNKSMIIINFVPLILTILLCLVGSFTLKSKIVALIFLLVSSYLLAVIKKRYNIAESKYELEIRKMGYLSISQYENNISKYITGPNGYYKEVLQSIIDKYKITEENTYHLKDLKDRTYILHDNKEKDEIYIINDNLKEIPRITRIKEGNIRYYRHDKDNKRIIFKTDLDEWYYVEENQKVFDEVIPDKKIETKQEFNPNEYIADFERFMKKIKDKDLTKQDANSKTKETSRNSMGLILLLIIIFLVLSYIYKEYRTILNIIFFVLIIILNKFLQTYLQVKNIGIRTENEYIKYLNNNKDCQDKFAELKLALNIPKEVHKIYSNEGAEFLVWDNAGYFHLFMNIIYFDVIYISVKLQEVKYYKEEGNTCILKIRDQNYIFNNEAKQVFDKLLPNKDYNWMQGLNFDKK